MYKNKFMQNEYFDESLFYKVDKMKPLPSKVSFIMSFSKALYIVDHDDMQFDLIMN